jgi:tetratricopeptide (TPR) repeat protein
MMATISEALAMALEHHQAGRLQAAEQIYRQILAADPGQADALHLLGVLAHQVGKHGIAIQYIGRALTRSAEQPSFHYNLGEVYRTVGEIAKATACYRRAVELDPEFAKAHNSLGSMLQDQGKLAEAVACYQRAIELKPDFAGAHYNLGNALRLWNRAEEAIACYRRAVQLQPDFADAHNNLGSVLQDQRRLEEAVACFRRVIELRPGFADAHYNLGNALRLRGDLAEAVTCYRRALERNPGLAEAHDNLGVALQDQGRLAEAVACYQRAIELKPDFAEAHCNLGVAWKEQGKFDDALACCRRALQLNPRYADGHLNQALLWLLHGDLANGWEEYEWRWQAKQRLAPEFQRQAWDGAPLAGKTILLIAEQGLGDTMQFVRYAPLVKRLGATVILHCQKPLLRLMASCPGIDRLAGPGDDLPPFDVCVPLLSLPRLFQTTLANVPATIPYLFAAPELVERWREKLARLAGFTIGVCWKGSPGYPADRSRSIPLAEFAPLAQVPGVHLVSLQKGLGSEQLAELGDRFAVTDLRQELDEASGPFMDTAAVMMNLDLVVSADTAVAHLAGALGVPVWLALPFVPDWRWLLDRPESPWYPTVRLFRQKKLDDWPAVFEEMKTALGRRPAADEPKRGLR